MTTELALVALLGLAAMTALTLLWRDRARLRAELAQRAGQVEELSSRVDALSAPGRAAHVAGAREPVEYVITGLGTPEPDEFVPARIEGRLFADILLRETVVKAAALGHGVRRALAPEVVWRVRGEVRRELKRVRKQRRQDLKLARRDWAARQRAGAA